MIAEQIRKSLGLSASRERELEKTEELTNPINIVDNCVL